MNYDSNVSHKLYLKYGLRHQPNDVEIKQWLDKTTYYQQLGHLAEQAGSQAASEVFYDFNTMGYRSKADTIETLLAEAKRKTNESRNR